MRRSEYIDILGYKIKSQVQNHIWISILLAGITSIAFFPAIDNDFVYWDDQFYITANPLISNPTLDSLKELFGKIVSLNYHPITMMSLWINAKLSGIDTASPFIITNIAIHFLNSILVYILANKFSEGKIILALFTAVVFAIHPMHVESVVWVSERKDVLYSLFFLLAMWAYWSYLKSYKTSYLILSLTIFLLSCLSKAMAVSLVPCLYILDFSKKRDFNCIRIHLEKVPFIVLASMVGIIAIDVQGGGNFGGLLALSKNANAIRFQGLGIMERLWNACFANFFYIKMFFSPTNQSPFHPYSLAEYYHYYIYILFSLLILGVLIWSIYTKGQALVFGLGFYTCTIVLVLQFIPVGSAIVTERYSYLPYIGLAYLIGMLIQKLWNEGYKILIFLFFLLISYFLVHKTQIQCNLWQDHITLFGNAVEKYPEDPFVRKTLGSGLWKEGKLDEAIYHTEENIPRPKKITERPWN